MDLLASFDMVLSRMSTKASALVGVDFLQYETWHFRRHFRR